MKRWLRSFIVTAFLFPILNGEGEVDVLPGSGPIPSEGGIDPASGMDLDTESTESRWIPRDPRVQPFLAVSFSPELDVDVPLDLEFMGDDGMRTTLRERMIPGKPMILAIVYYRCPKMCNLVINDMVRALTEVNYTPGKDFTVMAVSFDAEETHVTAAGKKRGSLELYGSFETEDSWHFMVGQQPEIDQLTRAVNFGYKYDPVSEEFSHGSGLLILTPDGRLSRFLPGIHFPTRDLQLSLVEAGEGKIGTLSDRIALLCYKYDPETGKYGLLIHRILITACLITIAAVAWLIFSLLRIEKRRFPDVVPTEPPKEVST